MKYPNDGAMVLLLALQTGERLDVQDGQLALTLTEQNTRIVGMPTDELDALENLGWVTITERGAEVTESGRYWLHRWMTRRYGGGRLVVKRKVKVNQS